MYAGVTDERYDMFLTGEVMLKASSSPMLICTICGASVSL